MVYEKPQKTAIFFEALVKLQALEDDQIKKFWPLGIRKILSKKILVVVGAVGGKILTCLGGGGI